MKKIRPDKGFTLMEIAVVVVILVILAAFAMFTYQGVEETRDATVVDSVQSSLQTILSQASARVEISPNSLNTTNVVRAVSASLTNRDELTLTGTDSGSAWTPDVYTLDFASSGRRARYEVDWFGHILLTQLTGFPHYHIVDGNIQKH